MLGSGKVLVTGGDGATTAELYDPATDTWSPAGDLGHDTSRSAPVRLYSGEVLLVNGDTQQVDLYNPDTNTWRQVASIPTDRTNAYSHNTFTATRLYSGSVLVVGGSSVDLYDPYNDRWTAAAPVGAPFWGHTGDPALLGAAADRGRRCEPRDLHDLFPAL
ncbi:kelch repeat-containing protein [Archangium lansingense]|uniref:kelch repeat-containing protein n=1 Tax=Archangium lansingense TaxID=2995310 RepID=UPI003B75E6E1